MKRLTIYLVILLMAFSIWASSALPTSACSFPIYPPDTAFRVATAVFKGRATGAVTPQALPFSNKIHGWAAPHISYDMRELLFAQRTEFEVSTAWKGAVPTSVIVNSMDKCGGFVFHPGEEYIVYAVEHKGKLRTSAVYGTNSTRFQWAEDYLEHLAGKPTVPLQLGFSWFTVGRMVCLTSLLLIGLLVVYRRRWDRQSTKNDTAVSP